MADLDPHTTRRHLIAEGERRLRDAGIPAARLESEVLLAHALGLGRGSLLLREDDPAGPRAAREFLADVETRAARYPLQYITGEQEFYSLAFRVDERVLIPRPETEMIVDEVLALAGSARQNAVRSGRGGGAPHSTREVTGESPRRERRSAADGAPTSVSRTRPERRSSGRRDPAPSIIDVGTGSGCIAIALAVNLPACRVIGIDLSPEALEVARANALRHGVEDRIDWVLGDGLGALGGGWTRAAMPEAAARAPGPQPRDPSSATSAGETRVPPASPPGSPEVEDDRHPAEPHRLDFVVSNPPYIDEADLPGLQPELRFEPRLALTPGADGLAFTARLIEDARGALRPGGWLLIELSAGRSGQARTLLPAGVWESVEVLPDLQGIPRLLKARRRSL